MAGLTTMIAPAGRDAAVPTRGDAHDLAVVLDHLVSDKKIQYRFAGSVIEVTLTIVGAA